MQRFILLKTIFLIAIISLIFSSCKKEPDLLGLDLIPEEELLNHDIIDTITIVAHSVRDSTSTKNMSTHLLGSINDPYFGKTTASIYTRYQLSSLKHKFGKNPVVDSIFLTIPYREIYGEKTFSQTIRIYEVTDTLSNYDTYYSYTTRNVGSELIGEATFVPNAVDSVYIDTTKVKPLMRIPLTTAFANRLLNASAETMASDSAFRLAFKGLYLVADDATSPGGSMMYLDITHELSRINLYYRYTDSVNNDEDTAKFLYPINTLSTRFNHYEHYNYEGADQGLLQQFAGNTIAGRDRLFLQAMAGTKIKLEFPHLENLANKKLAIHEADLIFETEDEADYPAPGLVAVREFAPKLATDTLNPFNYSYQTLPDESEGANHVDGTYKKGKYRIRITRYIQDRLIHPEEDDNPLILISTGGSLTANRAIIKGTEAGAGRMRLIIYYTPLD